jgi:hypothetical protein
MKRHISFMSGLYGKLLLGGIYLEGSLWDIHWDSCD